MEYLGLVLVVAKWGVFLALLRVFVAIAVSMVVKRDRRPRFARGSYMEDPRGGGDGES